MNASVVHCNAPTSTSRNVSKDSVFAAGSNATVHISIIVPVYNNSQDVTECLAALIASSNPGTEIIVVDDASTDETPSMAARMSVRILPLSKNSGPSSARNYGARHARGDILFFVDADVVVMPGAVARVEQAFADDPTLAAVFGSYDSHPRAKGVVTEYRNLLHHYVHQHGDVEASTFWGACGAIRRSVFEEIGGFDEKRFPRCIEDIELGYRIRQAGHRIVLDKALQGTHLKRWTLWSVIRTDVFCRAVPWTRLMLERRMAPNDLNLKLGQRTSLMLVAAAGLFALLTPFAIQLFALSASALCGVIALNRDLYLFFLRKRGLFFAAAAVSLHFLYYIYGGLTYLYVWTEFRLGTTLAEPRFKEKRFER